MLISIAKGENYMNERDRIIMNRYEQRKIKWRGTVVSIQVRATVWRYVLDNRTHREIGYNLFLDEEANETPGRFSVAISEIQQEKVRFRIGDEVSGTAWTKMYDESDYADYYCAGALKRIAAVGTNRIATQKLRKSNSPPKQAYRFCGIPTIFPTNYCKFQYLVIHY
jgi:hypothetical protein